MDPCAFTLCPTGTTCVTNQQTCQAECRRVKLDPCANVRCAGSCVVRKGRAYCVPVDYVLPVEA